MKMYDMASRLAFFLAEQVELEQSKIDSVRYGLEVILGEIIKWIILLVLAGILDILPGVVFSMFSSSLFRLVSGGNHCQDYWRCLALGMFVFLGGGRLAVYVAHLFSYQLLLMTILCGALFIVALVLIWAPGEVVYRKIKQEERLVFKVLSILFIAIWTGFTLLVINNYSISIVLAGFLAMIIQAISFTPVGYWAIDMFDLVLSRVLGERRCSHA